MELPSRTSFNDRPRLLFNCGVTALSMAHKFYAKVEELHGPVGSLAQTIGSLASPLAYTIQYQWLTLLAFTDDQILDIENAMVAIFPPLAYLFDKIDLLDEISETLPEKFDDVIDHFPEVIQYVPFLESASTQFKSLVNFMFSMLPEWVLDYMEEEEEEQEEEEEEEEMDADEFESTSRHMLPEKSPVYDEIHVKEIKGLTFMLTSAILDGIRHNDTGGMLTGGSTPLTNRSLVNDKFSRANTTCKKIDQVKGRKKEILLLQAHAEPEFEVHAEPEIEVHADREAHGSGCKEVAGDGCPILELFETGWHGKGSIS